MYIDIYFSNLLALSQCFELEFCVMLVIILLLCLYGAW